jgi:hypothetical protein
VTRRRRRGLELWPSRARRAATCRLVPWCALCATAAVVASGCGGAVRSVPAAGGVYGRTFSARTAEVQVVVHIAAARASTYILADGQADLSSSGCALTVLDAGVAVRELLAGSNLYVELPAAARGANGGKPWAEVELRSGRAQGPGVALGSPLTEVDPMPVLAQLRFRPRRVTVVGQATVGGRPVTEYRLTYPMEVLGRTEPDGTTPGGVLGLIAEVAGPRPQSLPVDVWVDSRGRVVELEAGATLKMELPSPTPAQAALANQLPTTLTVRLELGRFGQPVDIDLPGAQEVTRMPLSRLQAGLL